MISKIQMWILASRPKTLTAAIVPIVVATALAHNQGYIPDYMTAGLALISTVCIQIGTNFVNDAMDFKKGADTKDRLGPKRVTVSGLATYASVMRLAAAIFICAVLAGIPLVIKGGLPIIAIGLSSVLFGYAYTAGPFPLAYRGLGDLFVIIFFGVVAVGGLFFLHTMTYSLHALIAGLQVGFLATVLIAINNFRDIKGDTLAGKKTLAVRFGAKFARLEIFSLITGSFLLTAYWLIEKQSFFLLLPLLALPLAIKIIVAIYKTDPSPIYNSFLAKSAALHLLFGLLMSLGLFLA